MFLGPSGIGAHPGLPPFPPCVFQAFGAAGLSSNYLLALFFAWAPAQHFAGSLDEVRQATVAEMELEDAAAGMPRPACSAPDGQ